MRVNIGASLAIGCMFLLAGNALAKEATRSPQECARKSQVAGAKLRELAAVTEADAAYADANGGAFSPRLMEQFVQWYGAERARDARLPELWRTELSPEEIGQRQTAVERFSREEFAHRRASVAAIESEAARGCPALKRSRSLSRE